MLLSVFLFLAVICLLLGSNMTRNVSAKKESKVALPASLENPTSPELALGKSLFKANCASCHNKNMKDNMTGPALAGTAERWAEFPKEDLHAWIRNSGALIDTGHPRAVKLKKEWKSTMTSFPKLTDSEIDGILAYIGK